MEVQNNKRVLVILAGGIGNAVMFLPALILLNKNHPQFKIDFLITRNCSREVFKNIPFLNNVYQIQDNFIDIFKLFIKLFLNRYDFTIATMGINRLKSFLISRIIFSKKFICEKETNIENLHEVIRNFNIIKNLIHSENFNDLKLIYFLNEDERNIAADFFTNNIKKDFIAIAVGSGNFLKEKRWDIDKFLKLAELIVKELYLKVVLLGGKNEEQIIHNKIFDKSNIINCIGKFSLNETAALIEKSTLIVSNDCGLMHIAAALDKPVIAIFGPTIANKNRPYSNKSIIISKNYPCQPCYRYNKKIDCKSMRCLADISVDEVFEAIKKYQNYGT